MYFVKPDLTVELGLCPEDRHQVPGRGQDLSPHLDVQEPGLGLGNVQSGAGTGGHQYLATALITYKTKYKKPKYLRDHIELSQ